jgi:hypothetical protein
MARPYVWSASPRNSGDAPDYEKDSEKPIDDIHRLSGRREIEYLGKQPLNQENAQKDQATVEKYPQHRD